MSRLAFIEGFDHYSSHLDLDDNRMWTSGGYTGLNVSTFESGRAGGKCLKGDGASLTKILPDSPPFPSFLVGFALKHAPGSGKILTFGTSSFGDMCSLYTNYQGQIGVVPSNVEIDSSGDVIKSQFPNTLVRNAWYYIEIYVLFHVSNGRVIIRVDGETWVDESGVYTSNGGGHSYAQYVALRSDPYSTYKYYWDDLYLIGDANPLTDFKGPMKVVTLYPTADTAQKDFTPSSGADNFSLVDDVLVAPATIDSDSTYVQSSTVGHKDLYDFSDLPAGLGDPVAVQLTCRTKKDSATARNMQNVVLSNGVEAVGADWPLGTGSYSTIYDIWVEDPGLAIPGPWTQERINLMQAGVKISL